MSTTLLILASVLSVSAGDALPGCARHLSSGSLSTHCLFHHDREAAGDADVPLEDPREEGREEARRAQWPSSSAVRGVLCRRPSRFPDSNACAGGIFLSLSVLSVVLRL